MKLILMFVAGIVIGTIGISGTVNIFTKSITWVQQVSQEAAK